MPRVLVTGAAGFVGQWLCASLLERGDEVWGAYLGDAIPPGALDASRRDVVHWIACDVRRREHVRAALDAARPDAVVHLAAVSFVPAADADPGATMEANVVGAARLLGELRLRRGAGTLDPQVLVIGSGEQYGRHEPEAMPLGEHAPQRPMSVYAASKAAQEVVALEAQRSAGVRVVVARPFNHSGAGQAPSFVIPALARRALALRAAGGRTLTLGNTSPVRDFLHVRDVVAAYLALLERGATGEAYNIASGVGVDIATLARRILALLDLDAKLESDPALVRAVDVPVLVGDARKLRATTGWAPHLTLDTIIDDVIRAATH